MLQQIFCKYDLSTLVNGNKHLHQFISQLIGLVEAWRSKVDFKLCSDQVFVCRGHLFCMFEVFVYGNRQTTENNGKSQFLYRETVLQSQENNKTKSYLSPLPSHFRALQIILVDFYFTQVIASKILKHQYNFQDQLYSCLWIVLILRLFSLFKNSSGIRSMIHNSLLQLNILNACVWMFYWGSPYGQIPLNNSSI